MVKEKGSRMSKTRAREGGASVFTALLSSFYISAPPSARSKNFRAKPKQAGKKEGGWGEGIFARLLCPPKAGWGWEAFPPFGVKPNIKVKQFSIPFKRKNGARKIQKIERKLFCFARRNSAGGNAGAGLKVKIGIFVKKSSDFVQKAPPIYNFSVFKGCCLALTTLGLGFRRDFEVKFKIQKQFLPAQTEVRRAKLGQNEVLQTNLFCSAFGGTQSDNFKYFNCPITKTI
jgi:hypothetical protein